MLPSQTIQGWLQPALHGGQGVRMLKCNLSEVLQDFSLLELTCGAMPLHESSGMELVSALLTASTTGVSGKP